MTTVDDVSAKDKWSRLGRFAEILLGVTFVVSALLKAVDVTSFALQVSFYGVVREPTLVTSVAYATVLTETVLGAVLLAGWRLRGWTLRTVFALLVGFTGLLVYSWAFKGLEDCGCFGKFIKIGPGASIAKNLVMMAIMAVAWWGHRVADKISTAAHGRNRARLLTAAASVVIVMAGLAYGHLNSTPEPPTGEQPPDKDRPFAQIQFESDGAEWDLGVGDYFVALLSDSCEHCQEAVGRLNELPMFFPDMPPVVALCFGEEDGLQQFRDLTVPEFPTILIEPLTFFQFLGDADAPPRFVLIRDGAEVRHWNDELPDDVELIEIGGMLSSVN